MAEVPSTPEPIQRLIEAFHRLPGIGPKSAQRLAYHILRTSEQEALALTAAVTPANVPTLAEEWEDEGIWVSGTTENPETNENAVGLED